MASLTPIIMASLTPIKGTDFAIVDSERYDFTDTQSRIAYIDEKLEQIKDLRTRVESVKEMAINEYNCDYRQDLVYQDLLENLNCNMISYQEIEAIHNGYLKGREQDSVMVRIYGKIARLQLMFNHIVKDVGKKIAENQLEESFKKLDHYENTQSKKVFEYIKADIIKIFASKVFNSDIRSISRDLATRHLQELRDYLTDVDQKISHYFTWYRGCTIVDRIFQESKNIEELDNQMAEIWLANIKADVKQSFKYKVFSQNLDTIDYRSEDELIETLNNFEQIKDLRTQVESVKEMAINEYNCDYRQDLVYQDLLENLNCNMISHQEIEAIYNGCLEGRKQDSIMARIYGKIARLQLMFNHIVKDVGKKIAENQLEESFKKLDHYENTQSKKVFEYIKADIVKIFASKVFNSDIRSISRDLATRHLQELRDYLTDVGQKISHYFIWYRGCTIVDRIFQEAKNIEELDNQMAEIWLANLKAQVKQSFKYKVFSQNVETIDYRLEDELIETLNNCLDDLKQALIDDILEERKALEQEKKIKTSHIN